MQSFIKICSHKLCNAGQGDSIRTNVTLSGSTFDSNVATDRGGAINLQAGSLTVSNSTFLRNSATAPRSTQVGTGGALAVVDSCASGVCTPAIAVLTNASFSANNARQAGGALYFSATSAGLSYILCYHLSFILCRHNCICTRAWSLLHMPGPTPDLCTSHLCSQLEQKAVQQECILYSEHERSIDSFMCRASCWLRRLGSVAGTSLSYTGGRVQSNYVRFNLNARDKRGLGGGLYLASSSFALSGIAFANNSAYFGGALFTSADLSSGGTLQKLTYGMNTALMGELPCLELSPLLLACCCHASYKS